MITREYEWLLGEAKVQFMKSRNQYAIKHFPENSFLERKLWKSTIITLNALG